MIMKMAVIVPIATPLLMNHRGVMGNITNISTYINVHIRELKTLKSSLMQLHCLDIAVKMKAMPL